MAEKIVQLFEWHIIIHHRGATPEMGEYRISARSPLMAVVDVLSQLHPEQHLGITTVIVQRLYSATSEEIPEEGRPVLDRRD